MKTPTPDAPPEHEASWRLEVERDLTSLPWGQGVWGEELVLVCGRVVIYFLALFIPLAFCRETMYIFQAKTMLLQYGGLMLASLIIAHRILSTKPGSFWRTPATTLIIAFTCWEIFKCWDSICPVISWREMSRIFWLPVLAIS
ncbi:MAG: hypothetical protein HQL31_11035, partial [Planctomycetes bacterium]|nr:hypothetical protein [Planctomycetota bacterium]